MSTHVATLDHVANERTGPVPARWGTLDESLMMLGLAVIGSATVICSMWLVA